MDPTQARSQVTSSNFERLYLHYRRKLEDGAEVDVIPWFGRDARLHPFMLCQYVIHRALQRRPRSLGSKMLIPFGARRGVDCDHSSRSA